ncbi:MAG: glycosyltransferase family 2 protein [Winogradskyella sp.]|uniref:glycosyltransferase family 2 protein n=1 Tax=Winogradskyella sp. TaxID=1883156 RepID=UPI0025E66979|nr:glycosyltransferase family 2 protein [Winogradskyella sp.]NRB59541.1 glycosyltransferase family 2 protein [Winogradskyella sp.]
MNPLVSIITPMYNNQVVINKTIKSVINQTYSNWELLLVDDSSSDNTFEIAKQEASKDPRIRVFKNNKNEGAAVARNFGTKRAKGDFIAFLDADDLWLPNKLELQLEALKKADVCFSSYEWIDTKGNPLNIKVNALESLTYKKLLKANYIGNLTGIYNAKKLGKIFTKNLKKRQDWLLWLEAIKRSGKPAVGLQDTLAYYRNSEDSLSSNKVKLIKHNYKAYRKGLGFSMIKSCFYMILFLYEHLIVKRRRIKKIS